MNTEHEAAALIGQALKSEAKMRDKLRSVKGRVEFLIETLQREMQELGNAVKVEYTGHMALFRKQGEQWACVAIVNTRNLPDDIPEEWDISVPIPEPESVPEFEGW